MPGGDRTGPSGQGPMTGRGLGYCAGNDMAGYEERPGGFGRGRRRAFGRGRRHRYGWGNEFFSWQATKGVSEKTLLQNEARILREQLEAIEKRLADLEMKKD